MAGDSNIEWTDASWNPVRGCTVVSPGCKNCYAAKVAARFSGKGLAYEGLAFMHPKAGGQWTGEVRLIEEQLDAPLRWSRPRRIFVNSMSDLFHEALSIETIARVFAVMYLAPKHTFQVLTKRANRMREVLTDPWFYNLVLQAADELRDQRSHLQGVGISDPTKHPAPWVQLGVSVEGPEYLERVDQLLYSPAGVRFVSAEPLLAELDLFARLYPRIGERPALDWVIVGGESGQQARPFNIEWARRIVVDCKVAGVACFVKQLGADPRTIADLPCSPLASKKGGDPAEWPADLRVREFPEVRR